MDKRLFNEDSLSYQRNRHNPEQTGTYWHLPNFKLPKPKDNLGYIGNYTEQKLYDMYRAMMGIDYPSQYGMLDYAGMNTYPEEYMD